MVINCRSSRRHFTVVESFIQCCVSHHKALKFAYSANALDIDTLGKDSHALFEAGLDFAMLVTDKHHYLKSQHDLFAVLPTADVADWVIQIGNHYPADITLSFDNEGVLTDDDKRFTVNEFDALIIWLENRHADLIS